jgi:DNA-binding MarR family transcriptional regulator
MKELFDKDRHTGELEKLSFALVRVAYKLLGGDRMTLSYGTGVNIFGSEIHMICHIKRHPLSHISGIARNIDVSRGAVSQIVKKLEKKGLVTKVKNQENRKQVHLILTEQGEKAYEGHQKLHGVFTENLDTVLQQYTQEQVALISQFINELDISIDKLLEQVYTEAYFE